MITIEKIKQKGNPELLELYSDKVRCDHYDPCQTQVDMQEIYDANIRAEDLAAEILSRMR